MSESPLHLFNSLGRKVEEFHPITPGVVHMYTCGPTVYHFAHIGNLRAYLFTDVLRRVLQWKGYDVLHVMNITDVGHLTSDADTGEDKMEVAAGREGRTIWEIARFYTDAFREDIRRLNVLTPGIWCHATDHIQEMIDFAQVLHRNGYTYVLEDGLYFDTSRVPDYGRLALLDQEGQMEGARVEVTRGKRHPADFAVWRLSPKDKQRQMEWHSPWGVGAPGWHLECSCMGIKYLGRRFDIHTGGIDHRQVHHPNEVAQNQGFTGDPTGGVNYWLHNDFLVLRDHKMSKSSGKFLRLQSLIDAGIHPLVYRYLVLGASYRTALEFTHDSLLGARSGLSRILERLVQLRSQCADLDWAKPYREHGFSRGASFEFILESLIAPLTPKEREWVTRFEAAVSHDLNTAQAVGFLPELLNLSSLSVEARLRIVLLYDFVLGLNLLDLSPADLSLRPASKGSDIATPEEVEALLAERAAARQNKDFARSDVLRQGLEQRGVLIKDTRGGVQWEWKPAGELEDA